MVTIRVEAPDGATAERLARELARCGEVEAAAVDATGWQVTLSSMLDEGQVTVYALGVVIGLLRSGQLVTARVRVGSPGDTGESGGLSAPRT